MVGLYKEVCMGEIKFTPNGPGRYRKISRKHKVVSRRKPVGPPIGVRFGRRVIPFHELPTHVQAAQLATRKSAGDRDD